MEGVFAFFAESSFLGVFLFGERRVSRGVHWLSSVMVAAGAVLSGFFIVATNAWMQHPVGHQIVDGRAELTSLWALLSNPYVTWQYPHVISGSMITASMIVAGIGAFYVLAKRHEEAGRLFIRVGVPIGLLFAIVSMFPTAKLAIGGRVPAMAGRTFRQRSAESDMSALVDRALELRLAQGALESGKEMRECLGIVPHVSAGSVAAAPLAEAAFPTPEVALGGAEHGGAFKDGEVEANRFAQHIGQC
jgi:hypothetical protein